jgi:hypothetical protein
MTQSKDKARQVLASSNLSAEDKQTLTALVDSLPDEAETRAIACKETLAPVGELAGKLGDAGKAVADACAAGDGKALASAVEALVNRDSVLTEQVKLLSERVQATENIQLDQDRKAFLTANRAKITPAEEDKWIALWNKDRKATEELVAMLPNRVRTESVTLANSAAPSDPDAEWKANSDLRREFGDDLAAYKAFSKAEQAGLVRIHGKA